MEKNACLAHHHVTAVAQSLVERTVFGPLDFSEGNHGEDPVIKPINMLRSWKYIRIFIRYWWDNRSVCCFDIDDIVIKA